MSRLTEFLAATVNVPALKLGLEDKVFIINIAPWGFLDEEHILVKKIF